MTWHRAEDYDGQHAWGEWSQSYQAIAHDATSRRYGPPLAVDPAPFSWWQERRCQCGNRDFRRVTEQGVPIPMHA